MWKANLKIIDEIQNIKKNIIYNFYPIIRYFNLLQELPTLYGIYDCKIEFNFEYLGKKVVIDDLSKYILNNDIIEIILKPKEKLYYLQDGISKEIIKSSYRTKDLYEFYQKELKDTIDCEVLLIREDKKLLDVWFPPNFFYNRCVNRLVHKYNY